MSSAHTPGRGAWRRADLARNSSWRHEFTEADVSEIDSALRKAKANNPSLDLSRFTRTEFPLPSFATEVANLHEAMANGFGFKIYEGFPVDRYGPEELRAIYWGLAIHIGTPVSQSKRGDLLGDVRDIGTGISGRQGRGYTSNQELNFHCDAADVSGLFFLKKAKSGGISRIASSVAVHNEIAARRPDLLDVLYQPLHWSWQGNQTPGTNAYYSMPVFGRVGDRVSAAYVRTNILLAEQNAGAPPLSAEQVEAIEMVASVAAEEPMYFETMFEPGSMVFMNNHSTFHMRTQFQDWGEPERRRHLLRVWLSPPNNDQLPNTFSGFFNDLHAGTVRGGYRGHTDEPVFETT